MKQIFSYTLKYPTKEKVTKIQEDGSELTTLQEIEKEIKVIIKEPSRKEIEAAKNVYQETWADAVRRGILTRAIIDKTYDNSDGFLSELEKKDLQESIEKINEIREEYTKFKDIKEEDLTAEQKEQIEKLSSEFSSTQDKFNELERRSEILYRNSAETIAADKQITYNTLFLSYIEKDGKIEPVVPGDTIQVRLEKFDAIIENQSTEEAKTRAALYNTILYRNGKYINYLANGQIVPSQLEELNKQVDEGKIVL